MNRPRFGSRRSAGFTLVELAVALALVGVLAGIAVPSWQAQVRQARRADAHLAIGLVHQAQERWRSSHPAFATQLGRGALDLPALSPDGHYAVALGGGADGAASGFVVTATARGRQAADRACSVLRLVAEGGDLRFTSARSDGRDNDAAANRRCWGHR